MKNIRKTSHTIYDHKYHLCWITKYRYQVLKGDVGYRVREIVKQVCRQSGVEILQGHVRPEHVHILVSIPPELSVSKFMQYIKGRTGRKIMQEFESVRKRYYGGHLWARGYYSGTSGNITDEVIQEYIRNQDKEQEEDELFLVSE